MNLRHGEPIKNFGKNKIKHEMALCCIYRNLNSKIFSSNIALYECTLQLRIFLIS